MLIKRFAAVLAFVLAASLLHGQDTLRFMQYNLLNYGNTQNFCNTACKDANLSTVINRVRPDLLVVNEMSPIDALADRLMDNVLTPASNFTWQRAALTNTTSSPIVNMLYYNSQAFTLHEEAVISHSLRDINSYVLYLNDAGLQQGDTTFFRVIAVHYKAVGNANDVSIQNSQADAIMNFLASNPEPANVFLMGDLNIDNASQSSYQRLLNSTVTNLTFNDPLNQPGNWHNSSSFSGIHTQSTRDNNEADGGSGGGSDDRFDFILATDSALLDASGMQYLSGSYDVTGQNGTAFNQSALDLSGPSFSLRNALLQASDHYPVHADFVFETTAITSRPAAAAGKLRANLYPNPATGGVITLRLARRPAAGASLRIHSASGRLVRTRQLHERETTVQLNGLAPGLYAAEIRTADGRRFVRRFLKTAD